jgi:hypothetical protein
MFEVCPKHRETYGLITENRGQKTDDEGKKLRGREDMKVKR